MPAACSPAPEPLHTIARAARETGVPYSTLYSLVRSQRIPAVDVAGRTKLRLSEVRAAIRSIPAASPAASPVASA